MRTFVRVGGVQYGIQVHGEVRHVGAVEKELDGWKNNNKHVTWIEVPFCLQNGVRIRAGSYRY